MPLRPTATLLLCLACACGGDKPDPAAKPEAAHGGMMIELAAGGWFELHIAHGSGTVSIWAVDAAGGELKLPAPPTLEWPGESMVVLSGTKKDGAWVLSTRRCAGSRRATSSRCSWRTRSSTSTTHTSGV